MRVRFILLGVTGIIILALIASAIPTSIYSMPANTDPSIWSQGGNIYYHRSEVNHSLPYSSGSLSGRFKTLWQSCDQIVLLSADGSDQTSSNVCKPIEDVVSGCEMEIIGSARILLLASLIPAIAFLVELLVLFLCTRKKKDSNDGQQDDTKKGWIRRNYEPLMLIVTQLAAASLALAGGLQAQRIYASPICGVLQPPGDHFSSTIGGCFPCAFTAAGFGFFLCFCMFWYANGEKTLDCWHMSLFFLATTTISLMIASTLTPYYYIHKSVYVQNGVIIRSTNLLNQSEEYQSGRMIIQRTLWQECGKVKGQDQNSEISRPIIARHCWSLDEILPACHMRYVNATRGFMILTSFVAFVILFELVMVAFFFPDSFFTTPKRRFTVLLVLQVLSTIFALTAGALCTALYNSRLCGEQYALSDSASATLAIGPSTFMPFVAAFISLVGVCWVSLALAAEWKISSDNNDGTQLDEPLVTAAATTDGEQETLNGDEDHRRTEEDVALPRAAADTDTNNNDNRPSSPRATAPLLDEDDVGLTATLGVVVTSSSAADEGSTNNLDSAVTATAAPAIPADPSLVKWFETQGRTPGMFRPFLPKFVAEGYFSVAHLDYFLTIKDDAKREQILTRLTNANEFTHVLFMEAVRKSRDGQ